MPHSPFPVRLRAASIIPRWSIIHSLKQDYVSSHSFFVAIYSAQIAELIDWKGNGMVLLWAALTHDLDELFTGDLVAPVKRNILDASNASRFISRKMDELMPGLQPNREHDPEVKLIIKAADQLDALLYAIGEQALGNGIIAARIPSCYAKLRGAWFKLPCAGDKVYWGQEFGDVPKKITDLWLGTVCPAIDEHKDPLRYDIGK